MKAVTSRNKVTIEVMRIAIVMKVYRWSIGIEAVDADFFHLESQLTGNGASGRHQIRDDLMLCIDGDCAPAAKIEQIDATPTAGKPELNAVVHESLAPHPLANSGSHERVNRTLLEHSRADRVLDGIPTSVLEHHRLDTSQVQQM